MSVNKKAKVVFFVDTNIFLRTIIEDGTLGQQRDSKMFLERVRLGTYKAITSSLVLAEINWVLSSVYELSRKEIIPYLAGVVSLKNLRFDNVTSPSEALRLWSTYPIKFVDCIIASNPRLLKGGVMIVSYDKEFDKIPGIKRKEPHEIK